MEKVRTFAFSISPPFIRPTAPTLLSYTEPCAHPHCPFSRIAYLNFSGGRREAKRAVKEVDSLKDRGVHRGPHQGAGDEDRGVEGRAGGGTYRALLHGWRPRQRRRAGDQVPQDMIYDVLDMLDEQ